MAKKRAKKVVQAKETIKAKPVRLDLSPADHERLQACADKIGLNKASFARMVVLKALKECEEKKA